MNDRSRVEIGILGYDGETFLPGKTPYVIVKGTLKSHIPHVRGFWKQTAKPLNERGRKILVEQ